MSAPRADVDGSPRPRVLVVAPQPFFEDRGTPIAVRQVLEALTANGYDVDLLTFPLGRALPLPGVRHYRVGNPFRFTHVPIGFSVRKLVLDALLVHAMHRLLRDHRYVAVHAVEEAAFPAVWFARRQRIPVVYDMQSSLPEQLAQNRLFGLRPVRWMAAACERWLFRNAALVVCSAGLAAHVRRTAPATVVREWQFVPLPAPPSAKADASRLRRELDIPANAPVALYTGNFETYQGVDLLIGAIADVAARVPGVRFVLVGGTREGVPGSSDHVAQLLNRGTLKIVGRRPREDMPGFLAMADVLVSPRCYGDNAPLKVFDYLHAGCPIVATDIVAHRPILADGRSLLVAPDAASIATGILRVLENPAEALALREGARRYADEHLRWDDFVAAVGAWYLEAQRAPTNRRIVALA